jgi:hypothetical protein
LAVADAFDEQDEALGMDTYSLSTEGGLTFYGGIESADLDGSTLTLRLTPDAASAIGLPRLMVLRLMEEGAVAVVRDALSRLGLGP